MQHGYRAAFVCVRPIYDNLADGIKGASSSTFVSEAEPVPPPESPLLWGTYISDDFFSNFQSCMVNPALDEEEHS